MVTRQSTCFAKAEPLRRNRRGTMWWGPGKPIDTERYFVISSNMLGSSYGTTAPRSIDPRTGKPYGPHFPPITLGDIVTVQRRLLEKLGINRLLAVVGPSYGGMQAFSWATEFPDFMQGTVAVVTSLGPPPARYSSGSHQCCALIPTGTAATTMRLGVWSTRLPTCERI